MNSQKLLMTVGLCLMTALLVAPTAVAAPDLSDVTEEPDVNVLAGCVSEEHEVLGFPVYKYTRCTDDP